MIRKAVGILAATLMAVGVAQAQTPRNVTIGLSSTSFGTASARLAKEMGFFSKRGLEAKIIVLDSGNAATAALISGSLDFALSGTAEAILAQLRGLKVMLVANTYGGFAASLVLSKQAVAKVGVAPDAPLAERLKALNGLTIGSPSATSSATLGFRHAAQAAGANANFTYMAQPALPAALLTSAIHGFAASAPFWAVPIVQGSGVLWISGPKGELPPEELPASSGNLQVMRGFAEANTALVKDVVGAFDDLAKAIDDRPEDVKAEIAKLYTTLDAKTLDLLFASESVAWKAKHLTVADISHEIKYMQAIGMPLPPMGSFDPAAVILP